MKRRGITIIAILLMLVVLAAVIGAMVIAGSGTIGGEFVSARTEEARRAAEAGAQAALGFLNEAGAPATPWIFTAGPGPIPWLPMANGEAQYQVFHVTGVASGITCVNIGDPAQNILPSTSSTPMTTTVAQVPNDVNVHYLLSVGKTLSGHYRQVGVMYLAGSPPTILSQQVF